MKKYRIENSTVKGTSGLEFEVDDDSTTEEVNNTAYNMVAEHVDFALVEVTDRPPQEVA